MEKEHKIKCSCGHRFYVTKADASSVEWDFTDMDTYVFKCPKCGKSHFVSQFSL